MARTRAIHSANYDRQAILDRLMAATPEKAPVKQTRRASNDGTVSFKQAIVVKNCAEHLGDKFAWVDKPRPGRYIVSVNGDVLTPAQVSDIIAAWKASR